MKILHLTAGAGGFYCGTCIRDHALVRALAAAGHQAWLQPLYLPITAEGELCEMPPVVMSGINVYLQHALPPMRWLPRWMDAPLQSQALLASVGRRAGSTKAESLGALTVSMLLGADGPIHKEVRRLTDLLASGPRPDVVVISNSLLAGLIAPLQALGLPVVVTLQGEPHFIRAMGPRWEDEVWALVGRGLIAADGVVAVSQTAADLTVDAVNAALAAEAKGRGDVPQLDRSRVQVVPNGIDTRPFAEPIPQIRPAPVLGFLARLEAEKGLFELMEVFLELREKHPELRLAIAGTHRGGDDDALRVARARAESAGVADVVTFHPNLAASEKAGFLSSIDLLCAPTQKDETGALYVLEAMAAGVPVVGPRRGAVAEWLTATGGGVLVEPGDRGAMVAAIDGLLRDAGQRRRLGRQGRAAVLRDFSEEAMAARLVAVLEGVAARPNAATGG